MTTNELLDNIEKWFAEHEDGEFVCGPRVAPFSVIAPLKTTLQVLLTTKPQVVSLGIENSKSPEQLAMIGRYGLPGRSDVPRISELVGTRSVQFVGDMDPVDLMVFAWYRATLAPLQLVYLGVNDRLLADLGAVMTERVRIPLAPSESKSLVVLKQVFPDYREVIGSECDRVLSSGFKIELEAVNLRFASLAGCDPRGSCL
jgi:hypothetical protein